MVTKRSNGSIGGTLTCVWCDSVELDLQRTNNAEYPETLVEHYECRDCGNEFTNVLTAEGGL